MSDLIYVNNDLVAVEDTTIEIVGVAIQGAVGSPTASYWTAVAEGGLSAENAVATLAPGDHVVAHTDGIPRNATLSDLLAAIGSQNQNLVLASPNGSSGAVSLRALVEADIPSLAASKITSGEFNVARIPNLTLSKITDAGTMASQNANNVNITGGTIAGVAISGGSLNNTPIGGTTPSSGIFTTLQANGNTTLGDASTDTLTINGTAVTIPNGLNFDSDTLVIDATNNRVGFNKATPALMLDVNVGAINNEGFRISNGTNIVMSFQRLGTSGENSTMQFFSSGQVTPTIQFRTNSISYINTGNNFGLRTNNPSSALDVAGDIEVGDANAFYFGDPTTNNSWRLVRSGNDLVIQRRELGSWVTKSTIAA